MIAQRLRQLGLVVREAPEAVAVDLPLAGPPLLNPVTQAAMDRVTWAVREGWLVVVAPPALQGLMAVPLEGVESAERLEQRVRAGFQRYAAELQRRTAELRALHLAPELDAETLELRTVVRTPSAAYTLVADRMGNFRLVSVQRGGAPVAVPGEPALELSGFREPGALLRHLATLASEGLPAPMPLPAAAPPVRYGELVQAFGEAALVPPRSPLELVVELEVAGERYRFAAARVVGRTFRGLLARGRGQVWAERFELDAFPGVDGLVAQVLGVPREAVRILESQEE